jgi:hypothetical protein
MQAKTIYVFQKLGGEEILRASMLTLPARGVNTGRLRLKWCHDSLIEYLKDDVGPPFTSSVERIEGDTWVGYQSVTALRNDSFAVTRYLIGKSVRAAARVVFKMNKRDASHPALEIVESVCISDEQ